MAVLSTVPSFAANCSRFSPAKTPKFLQTVRAAASASADAIEVAGQRAVIEKQPQGVIFSTEEIKVRAGHDKAGSISVSVPRFCAKLKAEKVSPAPRSPPAPERALTKPPGLHICPPPGLTSHGESPASGSSSDILSYVQVPLPLPQIFAPSAALSTELWAAEEGKSSSVGNDDLEEMFKEIFETSSFAEDALEESRARKALPLPVLLSSRPQSSKLGSAPLYGMPLPRNFTSDQKISAAALPFVPGEVVKVRC